MTASLHDAIRDRARTARRTGQGKTTCPACSESRKPANRRQPVLSIHVDGERVVYHCWHCGIEGAVPMQTRPTKQRVVVPMKPAPLKAAPSTADETALAWLESARGIPRDLAERLGVVSAERWVRSQNGPAPCVGFAYRNEGVAYAIKWRTYPDKGWTQDGAAQTLYLAEHVPLGGDLIICEGEIDALSWHVVDEPAVSIPSGGIQADEPVDGARLRWIAHHDALLAKARRIYLAVDTDQVGETTANELARRLGKARCWKVTYPEGCKDTNDVLRQLGPDAVRSLKASATPWPVPGVASVADLRHRVIDLHRRGLPPGLPTGWSNVDKLVSVSDGNLIVLTGIPSSGKSTWLDNLLMNMMLRHSFRVAYASFENPVDIHLSKLLALWRLTPFGEGPTPRMSEEDVEEGLDWLNDRVAFIETDDIPTPEALFEKFDACIRRFGSKACIIDPFNYLRLTGEGTDGINEFLALCKIFCITREVCMFIVAHPAKPPSNTAEDWVPNGYSIAGSAHWYNRCDFGITIARKPGREVEVHVWKARFAHQGTKGVARLVYDPVTAAYDELRTPPPPPSRSAYQDAPF